MNEQLKQWNDWVTGGREGLKPSLCGANLCGANLRNASLRNASLCNASLCNADLCGANLRDAILRGANLCGANLCDADLCGANLCDANLRDAILCGANLRGADLCGANLRDANLCGANLCGANLCDANLRDANLRDAILCGANLRGAKNISPLQAAQLMTCPEEGDFIGWKKCSAGVIVKLKIPASAKRSSATGRKCRAEFVEVIEVVGADAGISSHDATVVYRAGETVKCDKWCEDRWQECAGGIHFFITRAEAEAY